MRAILKGIIVLIGLFPILALAMFQVSDPFHGTKPNRAVEPYNIIHTSDFPKKYQNSKYTFQTRRGWLRENITRLATQHHWSVVWHADNNYPVLLSTRLVGKDLPEVAGELMVHYPLEVHYNKRASIMMVVSNKKAKHK